jgi:hypothetical protein
MRRTPILVALAIALAHPVFGQAAETNPIKGLAWMVGGTWTADASSWGGGLKQIETRYMWADNDAFIRFTTHFIMEKGTIKNYDGSFFWNRDQSTLSMWYMDARTVITQSPVTVEGQTVVMRFHGPDFEGKPADLRVTLTRKAADLYNWLVEETSPDGAWKQLATIDYRRLPGT